MKLSELVTVILAVLKGSRLCQEDFKTIYRLYHKEMKKLETF